MPSPQLGMSSPQTTSPKIAAVSDTAVLETHLRQIHAHYKGGQWAQAITHCESVIALIAQSEQMADSLAAQPSAKPSAELSDKELHNTELPNAARPHTQPLATQAPTTQAPATEPSATEPSATEPSATPPIPASPVAELHIAKGDLFVKQDKVAEAIDSYEQALELHPQQPELLQKIENLYVQKAQKVKAEQGVSAAVRVYLKALQTHPRLFIAYNRLRYNLMRYEIPVGDPILQEIVQVCQHISEKEPSILPAQVALGYALTKLGDKQTAIAAYQQVSERFTRRQITARLSESNPQAAVALSTKAQPPSFMIIGAEKCGTTSLFQYLRQHPDVLPPIEKEIDFFDMEYEQGIDWYLSHFPLGTEVASSEQATAKRWITGETSANYLYSDVAPERVFQHFPAIKLAVILRHPIDRAASRYNMMVRNGAEKRSFETAVQEEIAIIQKAMDRSTDGQTIPWQALNRCRHIGNSLYYYHIQRWLKLFPSEQLTVVRSEDLFAQPAQTLSQLYQSIGLSSHHEQDYPKHNAGQYSPVEGDIRQMLSAFFAPHTRKLEALLNRSFDWE